MFFFISYYVLRNNNNYVLKNKNAVQVAWCSIDVCSIASPFILIVFRCFKPFCFEENKLFSIHNIMISGCSDTLLLPFFTCVLHLFSSSYNHSDLKKIIKMVKVAPSST